MAAASVVSLAELRQTRLHAEARQQLHEHVGRWLNEVDSRVKGNCSTPLMDSLDLLPVRT